MSLWGQYWWRNAWLRKYYSAKLLISTCYRWFLSRWVLSPFFMNRIKCNSLAVGAIIFKCMAFFACLKISTEEYPLYTVSNVPDTEIIYNIILRLKWKQCFWFIFVLMLILWASLLQRRAMSWKMDHAFLQLLTCACNVWIKEFNWKWKMSLAVWEENISTCESCWSLIQFYFQHYYWSSSSSPDDDDFSIDHQGASLHDLPNTLVRFSV